MQKNDEKSRNNRRLYNKTDTKSKKTIALVICLVMVISFTACAAPAGGDNSSMDTGMNNNTENTVAENSGAIRVVNVEAKELLAPSYEAPDPAAGIVARGANDFAFRLGAELLKSTGNENFVFSPFSVWLPLAALANATDEENKPALLDALSATGVDVSDVNNAASRMLYSLMKMQNKEFEEYGEYHNPLQIANAIFVDNNVTLKKDFAQTFMDYFRGTAINVDFSSQDAVDAVNQWASENTEGLITDIVQEFDPLTIAAIANAIYFSDRWDWEFDPDKTEKGVFHSPAGDTEAFFMLREGDGLVYFEDEKMQAMPLSFKSGGGMYIMLPKQGSAEELLASMTHERLNEIHENAVPATGRLLLPRFSIDNSIDGLKSALEAIGVPLFNDTTVPLTGGLVEENLEVYLSDAMQKAMITVDEKGTTAAAVTVMIIAATGMPMPTDPFEMVCDRPFAFILYDYTHDGGLQVLFTGVVNQP